MIYNSITDLIGKTPLVRFQSILESHTIIAKCEQFNPGLSIKDRVAKRIIEKNIKEGKIKKGSTVIAPSSGNTAVGLCLLSKKYEFNLIITTFADVPQQQIDLLKYLGADVLFFSTEDKANEKGGYIYEAYKLAEKTPNSLLIDQFYDEHNMQVHYEETAQEIIDDIDGPIDYFFVAVGSGGTFSGISKRLKENYPEMKTIVVEPIGGVLKDTFNNDPVKYIDHGIHSISGSFIPRNCDLKYADTVLSFEDKIYKDGCRMMASKEGVIVGSSTGFVIAAIKKYIGSNHIPKDARILFLITDSGIKEEFA